MVSKSKTKKSKARGGGSRVKSTDPGARNQTATNQSSSSLGNVVGGDSKTKRAHSLVGGGDKECKEDTHQKEREVKNESVQQERLLASLEGKPAEEAAEIAEESKDFELFHPVEEQTHISAEAWFNVGKNMLPVCLSGQEIVVDRWHINGRGFYVIDEGDSCLLSYKFDDGTIVQGRYRYIRVGEVVDIRYGPFARSIDPNWQEKEPFLPPDMSELIRKYSVTLVSEVMGKNDVPMVYLNQRLQGIIVAAGIPKWYGMSVDIHNFLISDSFLDIVEDYHTRRTAMAPQVLRIKARQYINNDKNLVKFGDDFVTFLAEDHYPSLLEILIIWLCKQLSYPILAYWFLEFLVMCKTYNSIMMCFFCLLLALYIRHRIFNGRWITMRIALYHCRGWKYEQSGIKINYASLLNIRQRCSQGISLPDVASFCKISCIKDLEVSCDLKNKLVSVYGCVLKGHPYIIPTTCFHNLYNGLRIRFTFAREYSSSILSGVVKNSIRYVDTLGLPSFTGTEQSSWIEKFPTKRKLQLLEGKDQGFVVDSVADLFVKREPYVGKWNTFKPRQIWNPKPSFMVWVGPTFQQINDHLAATFNHNHQITIDCGLSAEELGDKALRCSSRQRLFECDVSSWDGSLAPEWNEFEEHLVNTMVGDPQVKEALLSHWRKKWAHGNGISVRSTHGRRSGDPWTSSFNGFINAMIVRWIFRESLDSLEVCVKGDDNFIGVNSDLTTQQIVERYASIGMVVEVKEVTLYELGYCSGKFWPTTDGPKWGVCPFRVLAKLGINLNNHPAKVHKRLLLGTMISLLPVSGHVPIVGPFFRKLVEGASIKPLFIDDGYKYKNSSSTVHDVVPESYYWLSSYCGLTHDEILVVENFLLQLSLDDFPFVLEGELIEKAGRHMYGHSGCGEHYIVQESSIPSDPPRKEKFSVGTDDDWSGYAVSLFSALCEESVRRLLPYHAFTILFVLLELLSGNYYSWMLHLPLAMMGNFYLRLCLHLAWNTAAFLGLVPPGSLFSLITRKSKNSNKQGKRKGQKNTKKSKGMQGGNPIRAAVAAALRAAGAGVGGFVGGPAGANVGRNAGAWLSKVVGSGDYSVSNNSLVTTGVPEFTKSKRVVSIKHREFLGDITGSTAFSLRSFSLNPGDDTTFPWLSGVASCFQQYRFKGLLFEFISTSADALNSVNTALGALVMATQYNVNRPNFISKQEMEAYEFSCSTRPSASLLHPIECDPDETPISHLYVRSGAVPSGEDARMYDLGKFQIATVGMQAAATIGELWVTYDIELIKPRLQPYGAIAGHYTRIANGPFTNTDVFGSLQVTPTGDLGVTISSSGAGWDRIYFPPEISQGRFLINVVWIASVAVPLTLSTPTTSNMTLENFFNLGSSSNVYGPQTLATANRVNLSTVATIDGYNAAGSYIQLAGMVLPTTQTSVTITVVALQASNWT